MQYFQLRFSTAIHLSKILSSLCRNAVFAVKTESGALDGVITGCSREEDFYLSISTDRTLFICCEKRKGMSFFGCLDNHFNEPTIILRNYSNDFSNGLAGVGSKVLSGFSNKIPSRYITLPSKSRLVGYGCPTESIERYMKARATNYTEIANEVNDILPPVATLNRFRTVIKTVLRHDVHDGSSSHYSSEMTKESLSKCFNCSARIKKIPLKVTQRHVLCKDLVSLGYVNTDKSISLEMVIQKLHTTRASLSQGCKEATGIGPMEMLRFIRLDHVYQALSDSAVRQSLNLQSVEMFRKHYGFMSRGNFAGIYKTYFEESPRDTLIRSKAKQ